MAKSRSDKNYMIYQITCIPTGETYIGKCIIRKRAKLKSLKQRWKEHVRVSIQEPEKTAKRYLCQAIRHYGPEQFIPPTLVEVVPKRDVDAREAEIINTGDHALNTKKKVA